MWKQTIPTTMQGFGDYCKNMVQDNGNNGNSISITLRDTRDNNTYTVAKLKDGKCWMIDNLKLGSNNQTTLITSEKSDVSNNYTLPRGATSGFSIPDTGFFYLDNTKGGYYSWFAATAGTGTPSMASGNATSSICPRGWRLPTGGPGGEVEVMAKKYGDGTGTSAATSTALRATPVPGFTLYGGYNTNQGGYCANGEGYFQTSTAADADNNDPDSYSLYLTSSSVSPAYHSQGSCTEDKNTGKSIRCVSKE